jgi:hypothetical protein
MQSPRATADARFTDSDLGIVAGGGGRAGLSGGNGVHPIADPPGVSASQSTHFAHMSQMAQPPSGS